MFRLLNSFFLAALLVVSGLAQGKEVLPFDEAAWTQLRLAARRPLAVVFTTTDCEYCPAVIAGLARQLHRPGSKAKLAVVVMDTAQKDVSVLSGRHYTHADQLYAFSGAPDRLRYVVDPEWKGVTPYVVLLDRNGGQRGFLGMPPAGALKGTFIP